MQVILKEDVVNLGYKDDIVTVKDGYGRNFLIPTGKAVIASESAKKVLAENLKQRAHKLAKQAKRNSKNICYRCGNNARRMCLALTYQVAEFHKCRRCIAEYKESIGMLLHSQADACLGTGDAFLCSHRRCARVADAASF